MSGWRDRAACAGKDPELFFPLHNGQIRWAKAVCAGCPVRRPCLDDTLRVEVYEVPRADRYSVSGVRGEMSGAERLPWVVRLRAEEGIRDWDPEELEETEDGDNAA